MTKSEKTQPDTLTERLRKLADRQWSFNMPHTGIPETGVCEFVVRKLIQFSQLVNAYKEVPGFLREVIKMSQGEYDKF